MPHPTACLRTVLRAQDTARLSETVPELRRSLTALTTERCRIALCRMLGAVRAELRRRGVNR